MLDRALDGPRDHPAAWTGDLMTAVVAGEPLGLAGRADRSSMRLRAGARVTSTPFCVSADQPHLRLVHERRLAYVTVESAGGAWLIDDVFVDPYAK